MVTRLSLLTLLALSSCGPKPRLVYVTEALSWRVYVDEGMVLVPSTGGLDYAAAHLPALLSTLQDRDPRLTKGWLERSLKDVRMYWQDAPLAIGSDGSVTSGRAFCPGHSMELQNGPSWSYLIAHEMLHIAQDCLGQKEGLAPENYPGLDRGTYGHGGWTEDGFYADLWSISVVIEEGARNDTP